MANTRQMNVSLITDAVADDSDKTFVVPAGHVWVPQWIFVTLVSTVTVGNRQLDVLWTDEADNPILRLQAGAVQAASLTRLYSFAPGNPQETAFTATVMLRTMPFGFALPAGYKIRVFDSAVIAVAADDLTVRMMMEDLVS